MVSRTVAALGHLDTLIANAGIAEVKPILETSPAERQRMFEVNCGGLMNSYISAAKQMVVQGSGGRIIGAASIVSFNTFPMLGTYSASKWAVKGFTQVAAKEWAVSRFSFCTRQRRSSDLAPDPATSLLLSPAPWTTLTLSSSQKYGIRVCAYAPGIVDTPMWDIIDRELGKDVRLLLLALPSPTDAIRRWASQRERLGRSLSTTSSSSRGVACPRTLRSLCRSWRRRIRNT